MHNNSTLLRRLRHDLRTRLPEAGNRKSPFVRRLAAQYAKGCLPARREDILAACRDLLSSGDGWEHMIACLWLNRSITSSGSGDFRLFERWLHEHIFSWGTCDDFCRWVLNPLVEADIGLFPVIRGWTESANTWVRRASAVAFIKWRDGGYVVATPLRYVFEIADRLMQDKDPHVQKGLGWMLKAASVRHPKRVYDYLMRSRRLMPRTAFRYAVEKLPLPLRRKAMTS